MTINEMRAVKLYFRGTMTIYQIADRCWLTSAQVLHAVAMYLQARRRAAAGPCIRCPWRSGDRPCVWPACFKKKGIDDGLEKRSDQ